MILPQVCVELGLSCGDQSDAFRSKRLYVKSRLQSIRDEPTLLRIAEEVTKQFDVPSLADVLSELTTHADNRVSELTRREVLKAMNALEPLFGELDLIKSPRRDRASMAQTKQYWSRFR